MQFHLISEEDIRETKVCPYCKNDCKEKPLDTVLHFEKHYKEIDCDSCGRTIHFKVDFSGSGHDHMTKENGKKEAAAANKNETGKTTSKGVKTIESKIKLLEPT